MRKALIVGFTLILAACAQIPPSPQEIADKKMEPAPGKAVVYIVQDPFGNYSYDAGLTFDDGTQITTWPGTFYRWVTTPGTHTIESTEGNLNASIKLQVEAGKIYFVQHWVNGARGSTTDAGLQKIDDMAGHQLLATSTLCCNAL
jgi:hypothetical protein